MGLKERTIGTPKIPRCELRPRKRCKKKVQKRRGRIKIPKNNFPKKITNRKLV